MLSTLLAIPVARIMRRRKQLALRCTYCAQDYQDQLRQLGLTPSMSRKGNCYDNAPMESFWGTLKNGLVHHRRYDKPEQARREITEYIKIFYNRQRHHSRLGN